MRLGGWSRLGVVLSILYAALVGLFAYDGRPRLEYLQTAWFDEAAEVIAKSISKAEGKEVQTSLVRETYLKEWNIETLAWLEGVAKSPTERQRLFSEAIARVNERHKAELLSFPVQQRAHWLFAFAWWAGGTLLLFVGGWSLGWVYRGFRGNAA